MLLFDEFYVFTVYDFDERKKTMYSKKKSLKGRKLNQRV